MRPWQCHLSPEPSPKHPASVLSPGVLAGSWSLPPQPLGGLRSGYVLTKVANEEQARRAAGRWRQGSREPGPGPLPSLKVVAPGVGKGCGWPPPHLCAPLGFSRPVWVGAACPAPGPPSPPPSCPPSFCSPYWRISFSIRLSSHDWKSVSFMPSAVMSSSSCDPCSSDSVASPSGEESCSTWAMYFCWGKGGTAETR